MNGVTVQKNSGEAININVVRYFELNGFNYLIFSLNEIDDGGYVKLYISKIINGVGNTITDDVEWNLVKDTIKDIIKRNKDGIPNGISDLNETVLSNIIINDQKVFKLNDSLLQLLSANKSVKTVNDIVVEETIDDISSNLEQPVLPNNESLVSIENNVNNQTVTSPIQDDIPSFNDKIDKTPEMPQSVFPDINNNLYYGDVNTSVNNIEKDVDYKSLYEEEHKKNDELLQELNKYQNLINDLKAVLK